jgi:putative addiction module killer protein
LKTTIYSTTSKREPFTDWINSFKDRKIALRIKDRISRIAEFGSLGDYKHIKNGIYEMRFHFGSGYRVYFIFLSEEEILLLNGGDKSSQDRDIKRAKQYLEELQND